MKIDIFKKEIKKEIKNKEVILCFLKYIIIYIILNLIIIEINNLIIINISNNFKIFNKSFYNLIIALFLNVFKFPVTMLIIKNIIDNNYKSFKFSYYYSSLNRFFNIIKIYLFNIIFIFTINLLFLLLVYLIQIIPINFLQNYNILMIVTLILILFVFVIISNFQWIFYVMNLKYGGKVFKNFKDSLNILKKNFKSLLFLNLSFILWFIIPLLGFVFLLYGRSSLIQNLSQYPLMFGVGFWFIPYYFTTLVKYSEMIIEKYKA